jgi:hypothetical protein
MLSDRLVRMIEHHAEELTRALQGLRARGCLPGNDRGRQERTLNLLRPPVT